ncbi:MAG: C40 family peptidase [Lachnospiraceae bacterium]|nr:C40 family peptidase [Lachnospiraceae bacterium]
MNNAMKYLGVPYKWGAVGPKSFDCSGFMMWLYTQEGIEISRTSRQQYYNGTPVDRTELKPGDLVFFARNKSPKSIYHVGMIVEEDSTGNNKFIHSTRGGVKISSLTGHYNKRFYAARRIIS